MNPQHSIQTEQFEEQLRNSGRNYSAVTMFEDKIFLGDGRFDELDRNNKMVDLGSLRAALANPGTVDEASIYTNEYYKQYDAYEKIHDGIDGTAISARDYVGKHGKVAGAAGPESLTHYENIKKTSDLIGNVIGQERILEELNAINIAEKVSTQSLKAEYIKRTSALLTVQQEIGDDQIPSPQRQAFSIGKKEIFADATSWATELRDKDSKVDLMGQFQATIPGQFLQSKHDKVIAKVNALSGVNQDDWTAVTGNFYTNSASTNVKTAEKAIEKYQGEMIMLANSNTIDAYFDNIRAALDANSQSQKDDVAKSGKLPKNRRVTWYETDDITSESYVLARKGSYMKWLQGMVITTIFEDVRAPGAPKQKFWFDFNGFDESETTAAYRGITTRS